MKSFILQNKLAIVAILMLIITMISLFSHPTTGPTNPTYPPPMSPFSHKVGGIGIVEPSSENIHIGSSLSGIVRIIYYKTGSRVHKGDALFSLDNRDATAQLQLANAKLAAAKIAQADADYQLRLYERVTDKRAVSNDELSKKRYAAALAKAHVAEANANVSAATTTLDLLTVKAPIDGTILKTNIRLGEFASAGGTSNPLMVLGNIDDMHVRVEIDESDILRIKPYAKASGFIRGYASKAIPLRFVRIDPIIAPKKSYTNSSGEIIDTRVIDVIYAFNNRSLGAYDGQHMDVFIQADPISTNSAYKG